MHTPDEALGSPAGGSDNEANVAGRTPAPPPVGFGQLWQKRLQLTIFGPAADELMRYWKANLHDLWPAAGELYKPHRGIHEGDLLGIDLGMGPARLSTGVVVIESTDTAFTLMSPEGHMFAGTNRFAAEPADGGAAASVTIEMRAYDPLYELGLLFGGHRAEERFWAEMLWNLAARFDQRPRVRLRRHRLDRRRKWRHASNIRKNALVRTTVRRLGRKIGLVRA